MAQDRLSHPSSRYRVVIPRANNLDLLRFIFAAMVFFVHAYHLSNAKPLSFLGNVLSSSFAVDAFFVVSGFLIFMSYEYSTDIKSYFVKRIRRIYPAYFAVILACTLLGALISDLPLSSYFTAPALYRYLASNLAFMNFLQPDLPGVFSENQLSAVNGALWTLKIEVMFYISVPLLVWYFRKIGLWQGLLTVYVLSFIYHYVVGILIAQHGGGLYIEAQRQLPGQLMYFIAGGAIYYYFDKFSMYWKWVCLLAIGLYFIEQIYSLYIVHAIIVAIGVIYFGCIFKYLGNFAKYGDLSYGVYILHFPILQTLIAFGLFSSAPFLALGLPTVLVLASAFLMWHLVERPMLKNSSHYVAAGHSGYISEK
ncbi:MAG: acyltransferase family protein [Methylophilaceae bacterium]